LAADHWGWVGDRGRGCVAKERVGVPGRLHTR
jgi:hypothetical protein